MGRLKPTPWVPRIALNSDESDDIWTDYDQYDNNNNNIKNASHHHHRSTSASSGRHYHVPGGQIHHLHNRDGGNLFGPPHCHPTKNSDCPVPQQERYPGIISSTHGQRRWRRTSERHLRYETPVVVERGRHHRKVTGSPNNRQQTESRFVSFAHNPQAFSEGRQRQVERTKRPGEKPPRSHPRRQGGRRPSLPELSLRLHPPSHLTVEDSLPPLLALTVDKDFIAPALMASVLRLHILQSAMYLRQSNVKLQEELRDTMKSYGEEKSMLQAHLANLRLDLDELHHDNRTVTTEDTVSHASPSNNSESELRRLAEFDGETTSRSLQLPTIKNISGSLGKTGSSSARDSCNPSRRQRPKDQSSKSLRFTSNHGDVDNSTRSFLDNPSWETKQESHKFLELQRNQEVLRNIGRAHLKEKRQSLIRLPTINSAKKRNSLWDSGNNVSRPNGKSTDFELNPYIEDAIILNKRNFLIPIVNDPQRSEIVLKGSTKRPAINKRKVQFTRPRQEAETRVRLVVPEMNTPATEANSLNTSMADVSLEDNTLGNITFDDDAFKQMMNKVTLNVVAEETTKDDNADTTANNDGRDREDIAVRKAGQNKDDPSRPAENAAPLPLVKNSYLAKKNLELHNNLNNLRVSRLDLSPSVSAEETKSCKDSDRSVGTKLSQMSQQTEFRKTMYLNDMDPKKRNKALADIMFAVRSRMRENEEAIRFGQTPRPHDRAVDEYLFSKRAGSLNGSSVSHLTTPRWSNASNASPRKVKTIKRGPSYRTTDKPAAKRKGSNTAEVQTYLRKMYRQRKAIDRMAGTNFKVSHFAGHKQLRMVAQNA